MLGERVDPGRERKRKGVPMALGDRRYMSQAQTQARAGTYDERLRKYMPGVYNYMTLAMGITGLVAYAASRSPDLMATTDGTPLQRGVMPAPPGLVFFLSFRLNKTSPPASQITFWPFSADVRLAPAYILL